MYPYQIHHHHPFFHISFFALFILLGFILLLVFMVLNFKSKKTNNSKYNEDSYVEPPSAPYTRTEHYQNSPQPNYTSQQGGINQVSQNQSYPNGPAQTFSPPQQGYAQPARPGMSGLEGAALGAGGMFVAEELLNRDRNGGYDNGNETIINNNETVIDNSESGNTGANFDAPPDYSAPDNSADINVGGGSDDSSADIDIGGGSDDGGISFG